MREARGYNLISALKRKHQSDLFFSLSLLFIIIFIFTTFSMNSDETRSSTVANPAKRALLKDALKKPVPAPAYQPPTAAAARPPQPPPPQMKYPAHIRPQVISSPTDKLFSPASRGIQRLRVRRPLRGPIQPRPLSSVFKAMQDKKPQEKKVNKDF